MSQPRKSSTQEAKLKEDIGEKTINSSFQSPWVKLEIFCYVILITYLISWAITELVKEFNKHLTGRTPLRIGDGWFQGRRYDVSDFQWAEFRSHIFVSVPVAILVILGGRIVRYLSRNSVTALSWWNVTIGLFFVTYLSESRVLWPVLWTTLNYFALKTFNSSRFTPAVMWALNLFLIYFFEINHSNFSYFHPSLAFMDEYRGFFPWNGIPYMIVLRCMSFNLDYYWMLTKPFPLKHDLSYRSRQEIHQHPADYNFLVFFGYMFYQPTWITGPTVTYNAYVSQLKVPQQSYDTMDLILYTVRTIVIYIIKDYMDHYLYVNAYIKYIFRTGEWKNMDVYWLGAVSFIGLKSVYMKFLCIWRLYRTEALWDGIELPENMNRCMSDNYTVSGFWRSWHRGFNQWLLRYIYIPLGGSKSGPIVQIINVFITFAFVIFAHAPTVVSDPQILVWGMSMALFMVPEILAGKVFNSSALRWVKGYWIWRWIVAAGGSITIVVLIAANICGYGIALGGEEAVASVKSLLFYMFNFNNWKFVLVTFFAFFAATNVILAIRSLETEKERI